MTGGLAMAALGLALVHPDRVAHELSGHVLPAEIVVSVGLGFVFVPFSSTALIGVAPHDAGVASALVNATQQVGGSLGTALLNTVYASADRQLPRHPPRGHRHRQAPVHGYVTGFVVSAGIMAWPWSCRPS